MAGIKKTTDLGTKGVRNIADDAVMPATITIGNVSHTELGYLDGVTSAIQTQLNAKLSTAVTSLTGTANQVTVSASTGAVTVSLPSAITLNRPSATGWNAGSCFNLQIDGTTYSTIGVNGNYRVQLSGGLDISGSLILNSNSTGYYQYSTSTWSGNAGSGIGKLEYHSNRWYINAGDNSTEILRIRRGGTDEVIISNDGTVYAYGYRGNENVGGTGEASWHPAGIYSGSTNWLYGTIYTNGNTIYGGTYHATGVYNGPLSNSGAVVRLRSGNEGSFIWDGSFGFLVDNNRVKNFIIDHPADPNRYLVHACTEGPTADVFYRGEGQLTNGICVITLPDYFEDVAEAEGRSVMVTPIADEYGPAANLAAHEIHNGQFLVEQVGGYHVPNQRFWWRVDAVRKGTAFEVEPLKTSIQVMGEGPYTYSRKIA